METAIYILSTLTFTVVICLAVDISKVKKTVESLKEDSRQFLFLMQKLVDRLDGKDGDEDGNH